MKEKLTDVDTDGKQNKSEGQDSVQSVALKTRNGDGWNYAAPKFTWDVGTG